MIDMEYVPYNNANKDRARAQRREQTIAERIVWEILRKQRL
jgi:very-short-patch-repair endonuclease